MEMCCCSSPVNGDLTRCQVGALSERADLMQNGYMIVFQVMQDDWWFIKLRHYSNGRTLKIQWKPDYYEISEGKKILKQVCD